MYVEIRESSKSQTTASTLLQTPALLGSENTTLVRKREREDGACLSRNPGRYLFISQGSRSRVNKWAALFYYFKVVMIVRDLFT